MKRFKFLFVIALSIAIIASCFSFTAFAEEGEESSTTYEKTVEEKNNLATNKYDWITDKVSTGLAEIDETGITFENFNKGSSVYALYQTHKFNEFKFSMYAKLNLTKPSDCDLSYDHDYSNLYISFQINSDEPVAATTCPWNGNKANFSICFENLQGFSKVVLYLNESFVGNGANRQIVADTDTVNWNDGNFHWFELVVTNGIEEDVEYRGKTYDFTGKNIQFYFDGELALEYFQRDRFVSYKDAAGEGATTDYSFSNTSGYVGFWPSSDFPVGADTNSTNCYVEISTIEITSLDNGNTTPYEKCPVPEFDIERVIYSPAASYETDLEIEIRLDNLFSYDGEDELTYTAVCNGQSIGSFRNGYWVWMPTEAGEYDIDFTASNGVKSTVNYIYLNVVEAEGPAIPSNPSTSNGEGDGKDGGCGGGIGASSFGLVLIAAAAALKRGKKA